MEWTTKQNLRLGELSPAHQVAMINFINAVASMNSEQRCQLFKRLKLL